MSQKRAQITTFIIIGLVILAITGMLVAFFTSNSKIKERSSFIPVDTIQSYVESCISTTVEEGIFEMGKRGDYFILPAHSTIDLFENLPYYRDQEKNFYPSDEIVVEELALYLDTMLQFCLDDFAAFQQQGYTISQGKSSSAARLSSNTLKIETTLPLKVIYGEEQRDLSLFSIPIDITQWQDNRRVALSIASTFRDGEICTSCFSTAAAQHQLFVAILPHSDDTILIDITDKNYLFKTKPYHIRFALRYDDTIS